jgi:putative oxidoreductase
VRSKKTIKTLFPVVASGLIIFLFLYASLSKIFAFKTFVGEINNQPLPNSWTPFLSIAIPGCELLICGLLLFEGSRLIGFWISLVFMGVFTAYAAFILLHGFSYIPCSCGGVIEKLTWTQHLILNLFYVLLSAAAIRVQKAGASIASPAKP